MGLRRTTAVAACALIATLVPAIPAQAAPPAGFQDLLVVGTGLSEPSGFEIAPDGRIFVLERAGAVRIVKNGQLLSEPFAVLPSAATGDRGLLGIAFDPQFGGPNHDVYFYYTGTDLRNRVVRFDASGDVGAQGPFQIFESQTPSQLLHVGGTIAFGPDGKLYVAVGDNGLPENAQNLGNPFGKILRINRDGSIPSDNPFVGQAGKLGAIWAYGFRNPWRFQFDPATGRLYGGDVGQDSWEEINLIQAGHNYGWPTVEGVCTTTCVGYTNPVHAYAHEGSSAVTGGPVYRGTMFPPQYRGALFFADYARGFIRSATLNADGTVAQVSDFDANAGTVVDLKVAPDGSLYYLEIFPGSLRRIVYGTANRPPVAVASASVTEGAAPLQVEFSSAGSSDPDGDPVTYRWDFGDGTTSSAPNPQKTYTARGTYEVQLTISDGLYQAVAEPFAVYVGTRPTVTVNTPVQGQRYRAGDTIAYDIAATDGAGQPMGNGAVSVQVLLHHGTHVHPYLGPMTGTTGSFAIPTTGETSADTWYEMIVTATDADGLSTTKSVSVYPYTSRISLRTDVPGGVLLLDGIPTPMPSSVESVVGFHRELAAPPTLVGSDGRTYHFTGWSDGGAIRHVISVPDAETTYTANYALSAPFAGEYFANQNLAGTPVLTRQDPAVNFLWNLASPGPGVPADNFSARWTKTQYFAAGTYRFITVSDDGVRLYVDGALVIDEWRDHSATVHEAIVVLESGQHQVRMEFYENGWDALAKLTWETTVSTTQPQSTWSAQYWNTPGAGPAPAIPTRAADVSRTETAIDHQWWQASPAPGIAVDHFVARWTRTVDLAAGSYEFAVTADDGVRLYVDGQLVVDRWLDQSATTHKATLTLTGGAHQVVMEYYENAWDATAKLDWRTTTVPQTTWLAQYWNTPGGGSAPAIPTRAPDVTRSENAIDYQWWLGSPAPGITPDNFVARWTRSMDLMAGAHEFAVTADDGVRLYVDGQLVIDKWLDQSASTHTVTLNLTAGAHTVVMEYYENGWDATARLSVNHAAH